MDWLGKLITNQFVNSGDAQNSIIQVFKDLASGVGLVKTIMYPEVSLGDSINSLFGNIYGLILGIAIALIVLKVVHKANKTYGLGDDDPSQDPIFLFKKMLHAVIVAVGFNSILYFVLFGIVAGTVSTISGMVIGSLGQAFQDSFLSGDWTETLFNLIKNIADIFSAPFTSILLILYIISCIIMYFKFIMRSCELVFLRIGFPISCVGIIDSDYGVFKPYIKKFFQAATSIIIQIGLLHLSLGLILMPIVDANTSITMTNAIWACCCLWTAFSVPHILQEFLLWGGGGSSGFSSTINTGANVIRAVNIFK